MKQEDTIAAIATGMTDSGIGIIRISGCDAIQIADRIFNSKSNHKVSEMKSHTIHYGFIFDENTIIDEVILSIMKAPNSFTTEDTIEINCHGGVYVMTKILETVLKNGARPAEPGEFTKRAFLNGRIDLTRAEAVIDLIHSKNDLSIKNSVNQIRGSLYQRILNIKDQLLYEIAFIESALDDPEHISLDGYRERLNIKIKDITADMNELISTFKNGRILQEGIKTVIVGKPNVGKSSLLNIMSGSDRAIVTDVAGTTRDVIEENIYLNGINLKLLDTAGIRVTNDAVEKIGVEKAKKYADEADLIVYIVDASMELDENDREIIQMIQDKDAIVLLNKTDLKIILSEEEIETMTHKTVLSVSAKNRTGIKEFENLIKDMFIHQRISYDDEVMITNIRQKNALEQAVDSMSMVQQSIQDQMPEDFYSIDLMNAYTSICYIIGEQVDEDLVNEIFSKFCMGK